METPLLKRRLNPFLLVSTVLVLSLLAGLSVVYQSQLNDLVSTRQDLQKELDEKENIIKSLRGERSNLSTRVSTLNQSLEKTNAIIEEKEATITELESSLDNKTLFIQNRTSMIKELENEIGNTSQRAENLSESLDTICHGDSNLTATAEDECDKWT